MDVLHTRMALAETRFEKESDSRVVFARAPWWDPTELSPNPPEHGSLDSVRKDRALATFEKNRLILLSPSAQHPHGKAENGHATD